MGTFGNDIWALYDSLIVFATSLTRDRTKAEDIASETLLKAWVHRDRFEEGTNLKAWLFTILRNDFLSKRRKQKNAQDYLEGMQPVLDLFRNRAQESAQELNQVMEHIAHLLPDQRRALELVAIQQHSCEEAAEIESVHVGTMKTRVHRARTALKERLSPSSKKTAKTKLSTTKARSSRVTR